jgi:hypothetical protein
MSNVIPHSRALEYHAAARHVMRLACEKAVMLNALGPDVAYELQQRARTKMHTGEVRLATELVLQLSHPTRERRPHCLSGARSAS